MVAIGEAVTYHLTQFCPRAALYHVRRLLSWKKRHSTRPYYCERLFNHLPRNIVSGNGTVTWTSAGNKDTPLTIHSLKVEANVTVCSFGRRIRYELCSVMGVRENGDEGLLVMEKHVSIIPVWTAPLNMHTVLGLRAKE